MSSSSILTEKWLWIIIAVLILIVVTPFFIVWAILILPPPLNAIATICLVVLWGVAAGYKDWITSKRKEEAEKVQKPVGTN